MKLHWVLMPFLMFGLCFVAAYEQGESARKKAELSAAQSKVQVSENRPVETLRPK